MNDEAVVVTLFFTVRVLLVGGILFVLPRITRKGLLFGIYVGEEVAARDAAQALRRQWNRGVVVLMLLALSVGYSISLSGHPVTGNLTGTGVLLISALVHYIRMYRWARKLAPTDRTPQTQMASASLAVRESKGNLLALVSLVLCVLGGLATMAHAALSFEALPDQVPTFGNLFGLSEELTQKSIAAAILFPGLNLVVSSFLALLALLILSAKRSVRSGSGGRSAEAQDAFRVSMARFVSGTALLNCAFLSVLSVQTVMVLADRIPSLGISIGLVALAMVVFMLVSQIRIMKAYGQGGALLEQGSVEAPLSGGLADNQHWLLGVIYIDRDDPSVLVESRFGLGYTVNLGNRKALLMMMTFTVLILGLILAVPLSAAPTALHAQEDELPKPGLILDTYVRVTGGEAAYAELENRVEELTIEPVGSGMTASMTAFYARPNKAYFLIEAKAIGKIEQGTDGEIAWESSLRTGPTIMEGAERDLVIRTGTFDRVTRWRELFCRAECVGTAAIDGKPCHRVVLTTETGGTETHYYDQTSGFLIKVEETVQDAGLVEMFLDDYREADGVLFPHLFRRISMGQETLFTIDSKRHNVDIPADRFDLPDDVRSLLTRDRPDQRQLNLESFDRVWNIVNDQYWDPEFGGLDWQAVGDELRPRMMRASTMSEARLILNDMISRLELSHFAIIPTEVPVERERPQAAGASGGETGIDARVINGTALVTSVDKGSPAAQAGVRTGWEIIRINEFDVVARLKKLDRELPDTPSKRVKMAGEMIVRVRSGVGESVDVTFRNGEGDLVDLTIPFGEPRGRSARVGNFGYARVRIDVKTVGDDIGYIAVSKFLDPEYVMKTFDEAMESFMEADGIILDLRGNGGGKDAMALSMMGWLEPSEWVAGRLRTRGSETRMIVRPRARTYDGPVAVLTDGLTGSSAEFVAAALQEMGRTFVIGTRTKGEALPAEYTTLPNGDVFLYAVADFVTGAGERLEGVGVAPDIEVTLTPASLLEGRDIVLETAVIWLGAQDHQPGVVHRPRKRRAVAEHLAIPRLEQEAVAKFLGFYRDVQSGVEVEMVFQDGALAVRVPGMPDPLAFDPPDAEGYRTLQLNPQARIRFNEDKEGRVVSYTVCTPAGDVVRPRIERDSEP